MPQNVALHNAYYTTLRPLADTTTPPPHMNEKVLRTLEYTKIIEALADKAGSEPGMALCRALVPTADLDVITAAQQETSDALGRVLRKGAPSFGGNQDVGRSLKSLDIGSVISAAELLRIATLLETVSRVKQYGRPSREEDAPDSLTAFFEELEPLTPVSAEIRRCILDENYIADDASAGLRHVRKSMAQTNEKIHATLTGMVNGQFRTFLQDAVITQRDNRYCLPVKSEHKNQVAGMVHDQSSSGSTYFIEPAAVVGLNNKLRELELEERKEIEIILASLSAQVGQHTAAILANQKIMTNLDFIFAKAALALEQNATMPIFNESLRVNIRKGRHPLLKADAVVPIDIRLGDDFDLLVITGPNTGGKTVSLKTVGLLALMGQAGLHIPAGDRSELGVFGEVFADIGDEQSIEQSLSTFSSHMTTIVHILENAAYDSLCLFDELGAGTDPTEGAALAIAILKSLHRRRIRTLATTHYSELKLYALATEGVCNASCEFDIESLKPTYRLLIGVPGKSNAFAISAKLGLPAAIIAEAREQIDSDEISFEDVISDLEKNRLAMEQEKLETAAMRDEVARLKEQLQKKSERIEDMRERILREAEEEAREVLKEAKDFADLTIHTLQKAGVSGESMRELEQAREGLRGHIKDKEGRLGNRSSADSGAKIKEGEIKIGDRVQVISMGLTGTVNTLPDHKGHLFIQCGAMRSNVNIADLVILPPDDEEKTALKKSHKKVNLEKSAHISAEINLLGKTVDEALAGLDKYLDDAYMTHMPSVRVVHGKGTGALR
ncbi:MAG: endonuclease MutS2, partial [Lachnospiraceae bacterium]|nr:endonuclease MutS2 [Lachnospiraceae bacterium]